MTSTTTRAAIYCRMSEDQDDEQLGVERQRQDCLKLVERHCWTLVPDGKLDTFTDNDISGAKDATGRAAFGRTISAAEAGQVDVIVAYKQARIYRDTLRWLEFCSVVKDAGIETVALVASTDVALNGSKVMATIVAAMDEDYRGPNLACPRVAVSCIGYNRPHRVKGTAGRERNVEPDADARLPASMNLRPTIRCAYDFMLNRDGAIRASSGTGPFSVLICAERSRRPRRSNPKPRNERSSDLQPRADSTLYRSLAGSGCKWDRLQRVLEFLAFRHG